MVACASQEPITTAGERLGKARFAEQIPVHVLAELRTDHAGETGAVMIYRGVLSVSRNQAVREFAHHHLCTESQHLEIMGALLPGRFQSRLLPMWRIAGWLTGAVPSIFGPKAVYATIQAVETFVDRHYHAQIEMIDALRNTPQDRRSLTSHYLTRHRAMTEIRELLNVCRMDELMHRDDAKSRWQGRPGFLLGFWLHCVSVGSAVAVKISRRI